MCHEIFNSIESDFFLESTNIEKPGETYLIGWKFFILDLTNELPLIRSPFHRSKTFNYKVTEYGIKLETENSIQEQDLIFCLPLFSELGSFNDRVKIERRTLGGIHVHPFSKRFNIPLIIKEVDNYSNSAEHGRQVLYLSVAFEKDDVIFYDGVDVSVKELKILDTSKYQLKSTVNNDMTQLFKNSWESVSKFLL